MFKLFIVIPAYNEESTILSVINKIPRFIKNISEIKVVVVNDGSTDKTADLVKKSKAVLLNQKENQGVGSAFARGLDYALERGADIMVNIDADNQFDPAEIPLIIKPIIKNQADFVVGNRFFNGRPKNMPVIKYYGNKLMNFIISSLSGKKFQDVSCGFRAYNREAMLNLNLFGKFTYTQETFLDLSFKGLSVKQIPISVKYFKDRKSRVAGNLFAYTYKTMNIIIRSVLYYKPLKFFAYPGIFLILFGSFFVGFLLCHKISVGSFSPYKAYGFIGASLMTFGLVLLFTGLVADIMDKIRGTQEKILYNIKKNNFKQKQ